MRDDDNGWDNMDKAPIFKRLIEPLNCVMLVLAFWPVCCWYVLRTFDRSDEPWGIFALITAIYFVAKSGVRLKGNFAELNQVSGLQDHAPGAGGQGYSQLRSRRAVIFALLLFYMMTFSFAPHLVQGIIMVAVLWNWFAGSGTKCSKEPHGDSPTPNCDGEESDREEKHWTTLGELPWRWGIFGLLLLSLPIVPSINFFAGFPLRMLVTKIAQLMLACIGVNSVQEATVLVINNKPVSIDAPCSGISMLWVQLFTSMALACYFKLGAFRTVILTVVSVELVIIANSVRAVTLILFDQIVQMPMFGLQMNMYEPAVHVGVGAFAFVIILAATSLVAMKLSAIEKIENEKRITHDDVTAEIKFPHDAREAVHQTSSNVHSVSHSSVTSGALLSTGAPLTSFEHATGALSTIGKLATSGARSSVLLFALCICASIMPLLASTTGGAALRTAPPVWPTKILGHSVTAVQALDEEKAFAADFPGYMRRFTDGSNSYFVRVVNKETRQLHPSSDCFKGMGYSIEPQPLVETSSGVRWNSFYARKGGACYLIMEQLHDGHGHTWSDVSAWYWYALLHESEGPWWDITIAQPCSS